MALEQSEIFNGTNPNRRAIDTSQQRNFHDQ